jgi:hypothetical protein
MLIAGELPTLSITPDQVQRRRKLGASKANMKPLNSTGQTKNSP